MSNIAAIAAEIDVFQVQSIVPTILDAYGFPMEAAYVRSIQASGSEIYVGCSNGELLRYALQADDPNQLGSYTLLSRQSLPGEKPIDSLILLTGLNRVLVQSDRQLFFYTLPSLDPVSASVMRPIRGVVAFAVDERQLNPSEVTASQPAAVDIVVVKRAAIQLYTLRDRLVYLNEIPLPGGGVSAKRSGPSLLIADKEYFSLINLETFSMLPILPINQTGQQVDFELRPHIVAIGDSEFLLVSWTGENALGVFVKGDGDPSRGTLEWPSYPISICFDYPHITALLQNHSVEIHNVDTQSLVQIIPPPTDDDKPVPQGLSLATGGYIVPSARSDKLRTKTMPLLRGS